MMKSVFLTVRRLQDDVVNVVRDLPPLLHLPIPETSNWQGMSSSDIFAVPFTVPVPLLTLSSVPVPVPPSQFQFQFTVHNSLLHFNRFPPPLFNLCMNVLFGREKEKC